MDETWVQVGDNLNGASMDELGKSGVSMNGKGTRIIVGAKSSSAKFAGGFARIFEAVDGNWVQIGDDIEADKAYDGLWSVDMNEEGTRVIIGIIFADGKNSGYSGISRVFEETDGNWVQIGNDLSGEAYNDYFGWSVGMNGPGTRVIVGGPYNGNEVGTRSGHARVFQEVDGTWVQIGDDINGEAAYNNSGIGVDINGAGNRVIIGANLNDGGGGLVYAGHARVFEDVNGNWVQVGDDINGESSYDYAGNAVAISDDGKRIIVGAQNDDDKGTDAGHARVFEETNGNWVKVGDDIDGEASGDYAGLSVDMNGDGTKVIVGALGNDGNGSSSGHARVLQEIDGNWVQLGGDINGEASGDIAGYSVGISDDGTRVIVGSPGNTGRAGQARVFEDTNTKAPTSSPTSTPTWTPTAEPTTTPTTELKCKTFKERMPCNDKVGCFWKFKNEGTEGGKCRKCSMIAKKDKCNLKVGCTWNDSESVCG